MTIKDKVLRRFERGFVWTSESLSEKLNISSKRIISSLQNLHDLGEITIEGATRAKTGRPMFVYRRTRSIEERNQVRKERMNLKSYHDYHGFDKTPLVVLNFAELNRKPDNTTPFSTDEDDYGTRNFNRNELLHRMKMNDSKGLFPLVWEDGLSIDDFKIMNNVN